MTKERRLGRGLEALLGRIPEPSAPAEAPEGPYGGTTDEPYATSPVSHEPPPAPTVELAEPPPHDSGDVPESASTEPPSTEPALPQPPDAGGPRRIDVRQIDSNPSQPRQEFDPAEMQSLADSLGTHGLLQPVVVRRVDDRYQLIAGERRLRAAAQAGWAEVPANVIEADDRQTAELAIVENLQRKDLNPLEKAACFQRYLEQYRATQEELASRLNLDRSTIANLIRLLELPGPVQDVLRQAKITQGHARALLPLGDEREQIEFCQRIQRDGLSVRQTESAVQEAIEQADRESLTLIDRDGKSARPGRVPNEHLAALEQELRAALGTKVKITHNARGRGKLVIHFRSHEEFERLRRQLADTARPEVRAQVG
ncbi:MAG: ParB/RepB/Spo0J family partition protein [Pirellulales bacterium]|nr:ParB/RepB/Spo0J family partition protein [Pirellulales bacterium]